MAILGTVNRLLETFDPDHQALSYAVRGGHTNVVKRLDVDPTIRSFQSQIEIL
jgi:hypothetical protein